MSDPFKTDEPKSDPFAKKDEVVKQDNIVWSERHDGDKPGLGPKDDKKEKLEAPKKEWITTKEPEKVEAPEAAVKPAEPIKLGVRENARQRILEEYDGLESNVPINSSYWNR